MLDQLCPCIGYLKQLITSLLPDSPSSQHQQISLSQEPPLSQDRNLMSEDLFTTTKLTHPNIQPSQQQQKPRKFSSEYKPRQQTDLLQLDQHNDFINLGQVTLSIPQYGANYHLLKQKVRNVNVLLQNLKQCTEIKFKSSDKNPAHVRRSKMAKLRIWKKSDGSFICQYQLPCNYETYRKLCEVQTSPDDKNKGIKQFKKLQIFQPNLDLRYLCTQKIGMLQSRYFTYLKYTQPSKTHSKNYWQICLSKQVNKQGLKPESSTNARHGRLYSVSYVKEQENMEDGTKKIKIRTYISLDIHIVVENIWEKLLIQFKTYVEQLWETINKQNQQFI